MKPYISIVAGTALALAGCGSTTPVMPSPSPSPVPSPPTAVSRSGLVLLMHMEEPAWDGTRDQVIDSSGMGHHGTATPGATTAAAGKFGRGGSFSGAGSCVEVTDVPDLRPTTQLTLSAWALPNALGRGSPLGIISKRVDFQINSAYAFFFGTDDRLTVDLNTEDNRFGVATTFTNGTWYHVAMVYDGGLPAANRVTVYVNGAAVSTGTESASSITGFASPLWVGCLALTGSAQGFGGTLDEIAVWHRALTPAEIRILATATGPIA